jgi:hypothetical protein
VDSRCGPFSVIPSSGPKITPGLMTNATVVASWEAPVEVARMDGAPTNFPRPPPGFRWVRYLQTHSYPGTRYGPPEG